MSISFVDWATIIGGFAGFLSAIYVFIEKMLSGPKVLLGIRGSALRSSTECSTYLVTLELGNTGNELTTLTKVQLQLKGRTGIIDSFDTQKLNMGISSSLTMSIDDYRTWHLSPGEAYVQWFKFRENSVTYEKEYKVEGKVILTFLNHKELRRELNLFANSFLVENKSG